MNNSKIWLVVKPTVGIPILLSAVAVGSFAVHVAVLSKSNWYNAYMVGGLNAYETARLTQAPETQNASQQATVPGGQTVLVILPDGTTARAVLETPLVDASLAASPPRVIDN